MHATPGSLLLFGARPPVWQKWWAYKRLTTEIADSSSSSYSDGSSSIFLKLLGCVIDNRPSKVIHGNEITVIVTWIAEPAAEDAAAYPEQFARVGDMFTFSPSAWQCVTELVKDM